jgi:hypothetical protein
MSAGFIATVLSMISSTGSIKPTPKTFFHRRFAMTFVKRGFSGAVIQSANARKSPVSGLPSIVADWTASFGFASVYW